MAEPKPRPDAEWQRRQREVADQMAQTLAAKLSRTKLVAVAWQEIGECGTIREAAPFWERASTEAHCKALDVWASVHRARSAGVTECPKFDAIFERPRMLVAADEGRYIGADGNPVLANIAGPVGDGFDPDGIEAQVRTSTGNLDAPEFLLYLAVNDALRHSRDRDGQEYDGLLYSRVLMQFFARKGTYRAPKVLDPGNMKPADRHIVGDAIHAVGRAFRKMEIPR